MSYKEAIGRLDDLMGLADFAIANVRVVQTALSEKAVDAAEGGNALFAACEYLRDPHDQMEAIVHQARRDNELEVAV